MPVMQMTRPSMFITEMSEDWKITASVKEMISFTMPGQKDNTDPLHCFQKIQPATLRVRPEVYDTSKNSAHSIRKAINPPTDTRQIV